MTDSHPFFLLCTAGRRGERRDGIRVNRKNCVSARWQTHLDRGPSRDQRRGRQVVERVPVAQASGRRTSTMRCCKEPTVYCSWASVRLLVGILCTECCALTSTPTGPSTVGKIGKTSAWRVRGWVARAHVNTGQLLCTLKGHLWESPRGARWASVVRACVKGHPGRPLSGRPESRGLAEAAVWSRERLGWRECGGSYPEKALQRLLEVCAFLHVFANGRPWGGHPRTSHLVDLHRRGWAGRSGLPSRERCRGFSNARTRAPLPL